MKPKIWMGTDESKGEKLVFAPDCWITFLN